jgi:hypothetical protein
MRGSALSFVSERFPHVAERLARQIEGDEILWDLCEDLKACAEAADRLKAAGRGSAGLLKEYAALRLRLERELLRHVEESGEGRVSPGRLRPHGRKAAIARPRAAAHR